MDVKVGDIYVRHSDKKVYRVEKIDNIMVLLEEEDKSHRHLCLTNIFGLEKRYTKIETKSAWQPYKDYRCSFSLSLSLRMFKF